MSRQGLSDKESVEELSHVKGMSSVRKLKGQEAAYEENHRRSLKPEIGKQRGKGRNYNISRSRSEIIVKVNIIVR